MTRRRSRSAERPHSPGSSKRRKHSISSSSSHREREGARDRERGDRERGDRERRERHGSHREHSHRSSKSDEKHGTFSSRRKESRDDEPKPQSEKSEDPVTMNIYPGEDLKDTLRSPIDTGDFAEQQSAPLGSAHSLVAANSSEKSPISSAVAIVDNVTATTSLDPEEKIRQRRERVEQWVREREAAKKAEEVANQPINELVGSTLTTTYATQGWTTVEEVATRKDDDNEDDHQGQAKGWNLEDDDDDDAMEIDHEVVPETSKDPNLLPMKVSEKDDDNSESLVAKVGVRRNPFMNFNNKLSTNKSGEHVKAKPMMQIGLAKSTKTSVSELAKSSSPKVPENNAIQIPATSKRRVITLSKEITDPAIDSSHQKGDVSHAKANKDEEDEVDPLDAFMVDVTAEVQQLNKQDLKRLKQLEASKGKGDKLENVPTGDSEDVDEDEAEDVGSDPEDILALAAKKMKKKDLAAVDHSQIKYELFRKDFYIEPPEYRELTPDQVDLMRIELDGIKIRGMDCPKPIKKWTHCGLPSGCIEVIRKLNFHQPTPIQAQAIPAIMNGRDVIGVAKTGSGKTIAFLLPMFRHIKDQRPLENMEGPVAIIMTPTRELAVQIHKECKPFLKVLGLRAVCAYGGSPIKDQIADLKRGAEIIVCTPGRMIDLLCANSGRVTNLRRVTYMVLDEADRMFDMGFEPQVMKIVNNVRPDKQTVLFSATFPRQMEALARKVLRRPLEITVGGRSVVCEDVTQVVEVREDSTKFVRLLDILGQLYKDEEQDARTLIFVDRQEAADNLLRDLIRRGYACMSLHGGKDQTDRDSTIADFKSGVTQIMIATSVAARGLDVKQLKLVVNYECPNHMEDYVHRVGRTGRAGNKGTAYTFITPEQDRFAMDIVKALKLSGQPIPTDLQALADKFQEKVKTGSAHYASSGFGGKGLERLDKDRDLVKKIQKKAYGGEDEDEDEDEDTVVEIEAKPVPPSQPAGAKKDKEEVPNSPALLTTPTKMTEMPPALLAAFKAAEIVNRTVGTNTGVNVQKIMEDLKKRFGEPVINTQQSSEAPKEDVSNPGFAYEIEINDYPQKARWKVTNKEQISQITEISGAAITTRGTFFSPGKQPGPGERKLYLFIEGESEMVVENAKNEIRRILTETTLAAMEAEARGGGSSSSGMGRYSVV